MNELVTTMLAISVASFGLIVVAIFVADWVFISIQQIKQTIIKMDFE